MPSRFRCGMLAAAISMAAAAGAPAADRVQLILTPERGAPMTAGHEWARTLAGVGLRDVTVAGQATGQQVGISVEGVSGARIYVVRGGIDARGDLVLPGERFRRGEAGRVAAWAEELARLGPPETREPVVAMGLRMGQLDEIRRAFAVPVGFSTEDISLAEFLRRVQPQVPLPMSIDERLRRTAAEHRIGDELSEIACGAALALVLREVGAGVVPQANETGPVRLVVRTVRPDEEPWPVGQVPEAGFNRLVPGLLERLTVNIQGAQLDAVITAIAARLEVPVFFDRAALRAREIEPAEVFVDFPERRTNHHTLLERVLHRGRLQYEVRVDEAQRPFLWVTTFHPARLPTQ